MILLNVFFEKRIIGTYDLENYILNYVFPSLKERFVFFSRFFATLFSSFIFLIHLSGCCFMSGFCFLHFVCGGTISLLNTSLTLIP